MAKLFGTDGVRGVVGDLMTPTFALKMGHAIGAYFGPGSRVLLARDARAAGDALARAVAAGLMAEGVKVYYAGMVPTPTMQYGVKALGFDGGVMITASHNPREYNGIKVIEHDGVEIPHEREPIIEDYYFKGHETNLPWRSMVYDVADVSQVVIDTYVKAVVSQVDSDLIAKKGFTVLVDCANSVGAVTTPLILRELGVRAITVNCNLDPGFPGRNPEPNEENLALTLRFVREAGVNMGVAHDGDADRAILIDERGRLIWGDRAGALLTRFVVESGRWKGLPMRTYTAVSSSQLVEEYLRPTGVEVRWTPVGSVTIARTILSEGGAISGFEDNGGYMHVPHHTVRDGGMTTALALYMLALEGRSLGELYDSLPQYYAIKTKVEATREQALCGVEAVKEAFSGYRQITIDGVKVIGDDFWVLVRPSGTEPIMRISVEARTRERAEAIVKQVEDLYRSRCGGAGK
ncbi:phosphoglucomutase/phosphomannomutase alpha/beta/alpha domain IPhosphomannomutase - Sulfolobus solfataricus [Acidilobus saccharovorans 345-15]|uniref:Phosphoglucomutase/phosphomannomutase alpha/beta/alpha domain IPhosphomannomutase-Sulfolobus solfataricus n=1 Tax=Acidilobus saccharovorans (strain DSM 16705 / JCM 18335 / VKM B-2471 / 345-15) TaxID=666510 RepID=D9Q1G5_ACIS3|nr:phosphoglucosamine mutase [Acidilobus saccharovorans]ADL19153.1 phosphoglucomutase/phosphomannomutase alpha/beta/alpha domain IPhosphomannomutase - Sulfolobus solfataricus [Acidilobus saccharovorans 345-15]